MENNPISFRFLGIELVSKKMEQMPQDGVGKEFLFEVRVDNRVHEQAKLILVVVTITVRGGDSGAISLASIVVSTIFEVSDFDKNIRKNESGIFDIPIELDASLKPLAISTARGVMFSEFRGTYLAEAILPVINLSTFQENQEMPKPPKKFVENQKVKK